MARTAATSRRWTRSAQALGCVLWLGCGRDTTKHEPAQAAAQPDAGAERKYGLTPAQAAQVLVEVGTTQITLGQFAERLNEQSPYLRARYQNPERRREFLENMVRFELLAKEAEQRGFTHSADVERVRRETMVQQMMQDLFDKGGIALSDIGEDEIARYYAQHSSELNTAAQVRASHILLKDQGAAERCLKELQAHPASDMELFRKLARERSQDLGTKADGGDLRFFSETPDPAAETAEPVRPSAVRKAAFALQNVGDISPQLVRSEQGFHIVKLTAKRDALKRSLEDARRMIQNKLWRQKREQAIDQFVADLRKKANVQENAEALAKVQVKDGLGKTATPGAP